MYSGGTMAQICNSIAKKILQVASPSDLKPFSGPVLCVDSGSRPLFEFCPWLKAGVFPKVDEIRFFGIGGEG